jgi:hypothetical protein
MRLRIAFVAALALAAVTVSSASAQKHCKKGIPCGNSCISASKTCHVGQGSATGPGAVMKEAPAVDQSAAPAPVADGQYVASSRGRVYYWVGCSGWRKLAAANLRYFKTAADAEAAGYTPSGSKGCAGPTAPKE